MRTLTFISTAEIQRLRQTIAEPTQQCQVLSNLFRINTLSMIAQAGSGHIGTSFSSLDLFTWLWTQELQNPNQLSCPVIARSDSDVAISLAEHPMRGTINQDATISGDCHVAIAPRNDTISDIFFSSKGHDAPGLYAMLIGLGYLEEPLLHQLRRLHGLPGHPDVKTPTIVTNTGSLGMGISKARGMALANRLNGKQGRIYVLTGDGELQEGQFWESLQPTANGKFSEITVIVDHNKLQSDTFVSQVSDLGDLETKFRAFGWEVARCDGHDFHQLQQVLAHFKTISDRPQILIADTIKGKGVSFMEHTALPSHEPLPLYKFHSGAPSVEHYEAALQELLTGVKETLRALSLPALVTKTVEIEAPQPIASNAQRLVKAYGEELVTLGTENPELVVLDGDLMVDTGVYPFRQLFPERFIECGIAEQDMVSMAGGLALQGKLPVVHSFACFLSTRPNEQIFNNATEHTKVVYAGSLAGILPAAPGHSHQSTRDISALGSIVGLTLIEPCDELEARMALRWAVEENPESTYLRLVTVPLEIPYALPVGYRLQKGQGILLRPGQDAVIVAYGPVLLTEAYRASEQLKAQGLSVAVLNFPWLNIVDADWLQTALAPYDVILTLDDHILTLGQGTVLRSAMLNSPLASKTVLSLGLTEIPACGQPQEILAHHGLNADAIAQTLRSALREAPQKAHHH